MSRSCVWPTAMCCGPPQGPSRGCSGGAHAAVPATAGVDYHVPFGGRKGSSYGPREQGRSAAEFYTMVKTAYVAP